MAEVVLALDAGGTNLKYALMTGQTNTDEPAEQVAMDGGVLAAFAAAAGHAADMAKKAGHRILAAGVCCPGPFDFNAGQSHMQHKWQGAYRKPLAPVLQGVLGEIPVSFLHDSSAFMLGEGILGAGREAASPCGVMLGTGLGFSYMKRGRVWVTPRQRPHFSLWNTPFGDGIAEDYVSRRAIRARYGALGGDPALDVAAIARAAFGGDREALETFALTGRLLGEILSPIVTELGCDRLVLGGQISRSARLFAPAMQLPIPFCSARYLDDAALRGIAVYLARGHDHTIEEVEEA